MTTELELASLADRVEALSGPDREVDCLIWATVIHGGYEWVGNVLRIPKTSMRIGSIDPGEVQRNFGCWHDPVPAYTASLDAAMTLAPGDKYLRRASFNTALNKWWDADMKAGDFPRFLTAEFLRARSIQGEE